MTVETVREVESGGAPKQVLVRAGEEFFLVSTAIPFDTGKMETLVFRCDSEGAVSGYGQVAGGIGQTRSQAIADLERRLADGDLIDGVPDDYLDEVGGAAGVLAAGLDAMRSDALGQPYSEAPDEEALE